MPRLPSLPRLALPALPALPAMPLPAFLAAMDPPRRNLTLAFGASLLFHAALLAVRMRY